MKKVIIISWLITIIYSTCGCAASNKAHWIKIHHCDYSGANPVDKKGNLIDTTNIVKK